MAPMNRASSSKKTACNRELPASPAIIQTVFRASTLPRILVSVLGEFNSRSLHLSSILQLAALSSRVQKRMQGTPSIINSTCYDEQ